MTESAPAAQLDLKLYDDNVIPIRTTAFPKGKIYGDATFSDDRRYRWKLRRWWRAGPFVCWVMLNPSVANADRDDPTMREVMFHTHRLGYAGLVVVNLYPLVSTDPVVCQRWSEYDAPGRGPDLEARDRLMDNLYLVAGTARQAERVFVAWGGGAWDADWVEHVVEEIQGVEPFHDLWCLGKTASGAPKHPMARGIHRISRLQEPVLWRTAG